MSDDTFKRPIGVFDSGIGGLTVVRALIEAMPEENIFYFGDTAHFPYGDKSQVAIETYSLRIVDLLLENRCKLILIACGTASSAAYVSIRDHVANKALVVNVIDPVITFLGLNYRNRNVGLIATRLTVNSNVYAEKIRALNAAIKFRSKATPLIVAAIEEGFYDTKVIDELLAIYLNDPQLNDIDALILACTHFPLVADKICAFYRDKVDIIDPSVIVAEEVKTLLKQSSLLNSGAKSMQRFFISDFTESFAASARRFFGKNIELEFYPLWTV